MRYGKRVRYSVNDSVWLSVRDSVWRSVVDSVWDSVGRSVWHSVNRVTLEQRRGQRRVEVNTNQQQLRGGVQP